MIRHEAKVYPCCYDGPKTALPIAHFAFQSSLRLSVSGGALFTQIVGGWEGANYCYGERGHYELVVRWSAGLRLLPDYTALHLAR